LAKKADSHEQKHKISNYELKIPISKQQMKVIKQIGPETLKDATSAKHQKEE